MNAILSAWLVSVAVLVGLAIWLSTKMSPARVPLGILIDGRGRYSLTHFQLVLWSIVVLSLVSGIFFGRLIHGVDNPFAFSIPDQVLGLLGISAGSAVAAGVVKASKDATASSRVAASGAADPPRLVQMFLLEEGAYADRVIDVTKFQNFTVTLVLAVAYVVLSVHTIDTASAVLALPKFSGTFLVLLGISHGAYLTGKIPSQAGDAPGMTIANRSAVEEAQRMEPPPQRPFIPRNAAR